MIRAMSTSLAPEITAYYDRSDEAARLIGQAAGRLEFLRTQELLARHLPAPPARLLDVGGGAGIHALPLAARGYEVDLLDPVERHLEQARRASAGAERPLSSIEAGDARHLDAPDATYDGVLLLGPLYHLTEAADRLAALTEARRVVKPDGVVVGAAISRFASTIDGLRLSFLRESEFEAIIEVDVCTGQHRNPGQRKGWFTTAYFHRPEELRSELERAGLPPIGVFAVEGLAWTLPDLATWLDDPGDRARLLAALARVEAEPSLLGASAHLLGVGKRPR
jgi:ubiquinone/menaquinone biosynthesis C-methylase UbiE